MVENGFIGGARPLPPHEFQNEPHDQFLELCAIATTGSLSAEERRRLEGHLKDCAACREALSQYEAIIGGAIPAMAPEPSLLKDREQITAWSPDLTEAKLFARLKEDEERVERALTWASAPTRPSDSSGENLWRHVWWQFAAGLLLSVAFGTSLYKVGIRRGVASARLAPPTTPAMQPSGPARTEQTAAGPVPANELTSKKDAQVGILQEQLEEREIEFHSVFENVLDAILILDGRATCRDANPSALQLFGIRREQLIGRPIATFYRDRDRFNSAWKRLLTQKHDRGESEIMRPDGERIFVEFTATADFLPDRHLISLRDVTQRRSAEEEREKSLAIAQSAWREADALRQATLALTQDLRMNSVLTTLLGLLHRQMPYETAQVLLVETDSRLFLAQERIARGDSGHLAAFPDTLNASEYPVLQRALRNPGGVLIHNTFEECDWKDIAPDTTARSWLGIPLYSADRLLGLLCVTHSHPGQFTAEHLRVARSLAPSASVVIQNARLYERAEIYASELNRRLSNLH